MRYARLASVLAFSTVLSVGCQEPPIAPDVETPVSLQIISGDEQQGAPGEELPAPLVVRVVNQWNWGVPRQLVNFRVVEGDGSMWAGSSLTDIRGYARDYWTLGLNGTQRVEARAVDPTTGEKQVFGEFTATLSAVDGDGDGFDASVDCDDTDAGVYPGAPEVLDGKDNDCDGDIDEGIFPDADQDGFASDVDCDDGDPSVNPGATEVLDGKDNNCDGEVDEGLGPEVCDNIDNDADGTTDEGLPYCFEGNPAPNTDGSVCDDGYFDLDGDPANGCESESMFPDADSDGFTSDVDCDDNNPSIYPGAEEVADFVDNDCDGQIDEGVFFPDPYEPNDSFGEAALLGSADQLLVVDANFDDVSVDVHDFYRIELTEDGSSVCLPGESESFTLHLALIPPFSEDYDLYVYDVDGTLLDQSIGTTGTEQIAHDLDGTCGIADTWERIIEVTAAPGAGEGEYSLEIEFAEN